MIVAAPQRLARRNQTSEVARGPLIARRPGGRQQALRGDPALRALHPLGDQIDDRVVVVPTRHPGRRRTTRLMAGNHPSHRLRCRAADRSRATVAAHLPVGGNDVHPFPRRLQWSPPGRCGDWLAPPPSPPRAHAPGRHDERGMGTSTWPPAGTYTWPSTRTFPWPWTGRLRKLYTDERGSTAQRRSPPCGPRPSTSAARTHQVQLLRVSTLGRGATPARPRRSRGTHAGGN